MYHVSDFSYHRARQQRQCYYIFIHFHFIVMNRYYNFKGEVILISLLLKLI